MDCFVRLRQNTVNRGVHTSNLPVTIIVIIRLSNDGVFQGSKPGLMSLAVSVVKIPERIYRNLLNQ